MAKEEAKKVAQTLTEQPTIVRIGMFWFLQKPLTMAQIYEIGAIIENTEELDDSVKAQPISAILARYKDIKVCTEVVVTMLFRGRFKRWLWRKYILNHLTMATYKQVFEYGAMTFQAAFFLTSFIFLKGIKTTTSKTNTEEATAHGDSWEEL